MSKSEGGIFVQCLHSMLPRVRLYRHMRYIGQNGQNIKLHRPKYFFRANYKSENTDFILIYKEMHKNLEEIKCKMTTIVSLI